jgi:hypothetical protein
MRAWSLGSWGVLAVGCVAVLAACGSVGSGGSPGSTASLEFARCMRAHGVPNFPDPGAGGAIELGSGLDTQSPAFQAAQRGCIPILRAGGQRHAPTAGQRTAMLRFARCMRGHRIPDFPDPETPAQVPPNTNVLGVGGLVFPLGSTINISSPAFRQAAAVCGLGRPAGQPKGG